MEIKLILTFAFSISIIGFGNCTSNYGKVNCKGTKKVPEIGLLGTFAKAKCTLPAKLTDEEAAKIVRCVLLYVKGYSSPNKFNQKNVENLLLSVFPSKYHPGLKSKITSCIKLNGKNVKDAGADPAASSWVEFYKCLKNWWDKELCK